ncbi:MAG: HD domain-containing protein [Proteobacteria bacterium]|nr:HD domain-containing protein [Pseudomonadota bacterium]
MSESGGKDRPPVDPGASQGLRGVDSRDRRLRHPGRPVDPEEVYPEALDQPPPPTGAAPPPPGAAPVSPEVSQPESLSRAVYFFTSYFMAALRNSMLYSPDHAQVGSSLPRAVQQAEHAFTFTDKLEFVRIEGELLFEGKPLNRQGVQFGKVAEFMGKLGIERLCFLPGLEDRELKDLVLDLLGRTGEGEKRGSRTIASTEHVRVGKIHMAAGGGGARVPKLSHHAIVNLLATGRFSEDDISDLSASSQETTGERLAQIDTALLVRARNAVSKLSTLDASERVSIQETVVNFIHYFLKYARSLYILAPLVTHHEPTFHHSLNVALLCGVQARTLGADPAQFRDMVLAGLFHDLGKLAIPVHILDKVQPLSREEKILITGHPVQGARILACLPDAPPAAVVAAFEHHMHFSGEGGYPRPGPGREPHTVSQVVALADFYDAALSRKPYRPPRILENILDLMVGHAGQRFDPKLVMNFLEAVRGWE